MIKTITFKNKVYPQFQSEGFAAQFAFPFAKKAFEGCENIIDVGCNKYEWAYPGSIMADPLINKYDAMYLPNHINNKPINGIISSHMLEHFEGSWTNVLDYWHTILGNKGVLFLYLPDHSQVYWRPHHNLKHIHCFTPDILRAYFEDQPEKWENIFVSGVDLNNSFMVMCNKA